MAKTQNQFIERVLKRLKALASGQQMAAEDAETIRELMVPAFSELSRRGTFHVSDPESIEDEAFLALVDYVAVEAASEFGVSEAQLASDNISRAVAEARLRVLQQVLPAEHSAEGVYF